jgi:transcriptional regulator with XRE-family HTH domain
MKYGERLKIARKHAELSQAALAERAGVSQPTVHYLEDVANNAQGSEHTTRFARACGISADWLSDEIGEMMPINEVSEPIRHLMTRLSTMTEREQYRIVRIVDAFADDASTNDCDEPSHCDERKVGG